MTEPEEATPEQARKALEDAADEIREHSGTMAGLGLAGLAGGVLLGGVRRRMRLPRRTRKRWLRRFGFGLLIVVSSVATCSVGVDPSTLTASYGDPIPASSAEAANLLTRASEALHRAPEARDFRITLTEREATSALSLGMMLPELMRASETIPAEEIQAASDLGALRDRIWAEADRQRSAQADAARFPYSVLIKLDPKIRTGDVQVRFEPNGEMVVAGFVQAWGFRQPGIFVFAPSAQGGELTLDFVSGRLGRLPLPEPVFDWLGRAVASAVLLGREHVEVSEISVGDGTITLGGGLAGS